MNLSEANWPALPLAEWQATYDTLHLWTQIIGKIRLTLTPLQNHWWNVALYPTARGLTTSPMPYAGLGLEIQFDFIDHALKFQTSDGRARALRLQAKSVATFYREVLATLQGIGIEVKIDTDPQEIPGAIALDQDETHASYDPEYASRWWRILLSTEFVLQEFRSRFRGKASPVHFFWGSFDLAYTRFSGRMAPPRKGIVTAEAYSCECMSVGWWPGGGDMKGAAFYAYMAPEPAGYGKQKILPPGGFYSDKMHEFFLMYDDVRQTKSPRAEILAFAQSAYEAGANLAGWDRASLDCDWMQK